jgi:hypothetical protein
MRRARVSIGRGLLRFHGSDGELPADNKTLGMIQLRVWMVHIALGQLGGATC